MKAVISKVGIRCGRPKVIPEDVMAEVKLAITERSKTGAVLNSNTVRSVIVGALAKMEKMEYLACLKLSKSWINRLLTKMGLSYRRVTGAAQKVSLFFMCL